jgi:hypothetical protein
MSDYPSFPKIPRSSNSVVWATEKLDGTNGLVYVPLNPAEPVRAGSRNRWLKGNGSKSDDNFGFAAWVEENAEALRRLGPGHHYGEWWGKGIGRAYGLEERRWWLFDALRWTPERLPEGLPAALGVVPLLCVRSLDKSAEVVAAGEWVLKTHSVAVPSWLKPEGYVLSVGSFSANNRVKVTDQMQGAKTPREEHE